MNLLYAFMITVIVPFHAMCAERELTEKRPKLILDQYQGVSKSFDFPVGEPENERLWKKWLLIKSPNDRCCRFTDAAENEGLLRWLIARREKELSQSHS